MAVVRFLGVVLIMTMLGLGFVHAQFNFNVSNYASFSSASLFVYYQDNSLMLNAYLLDPHNASYPNDIPTSYQLSWSWRNFDKKGGFDNSSTGLQLSNQITYFSFNSLYENDIARRIDQNLTTPHNATKREEESEAETEERFNRPLYSTGFTSQNYLMKQDAAILIGGTDDNPLAYPVTNNSLLFVFDYQPLDDLDTKVSYTVEALFTTALVVAPTFIYDNNILTAINLTGPNNTTFVLDMPTQIVVDDIVQDITAINVTESPIDYLHVYTLTFTLPPFSKHMTMFASVRSPEVLLKSGDGNDDSDNVTTILIAVLVPVAGLTVLGVIAIALIVILVLAVLRSRVSLHDSDLVSF